MRGEKNLKKEKKNVNSVAQGGVCADKNRNGEVSAPWST